MRSHPFGLSLSKPFPSFQPCQERKALRQARGERWLLALWFAILTSLVAAPAAAQTFPPLTGRVVDQANIIPDEREAAMTQQLEQLQRATSRQLVVATVSSLEGNEIQDYAYRLGRQWQIGQAGANNGVVLLVAPNERRVWITTGYGLEGILTDAFTGQIIREQILPRFRENDYPGGIEAGVNALIVQLAAPPEQAERRALDAERTRQQRGSGGRSGDGIIVLVVFGFIILIFIGAASNALGGRRYRRGRASPWGASYGRRDSGSDIGWFLAGVAFDILTSGRGGGRGGGSSWGGGGGGGGGFSGGGGSFGGGGAGGSW